MPNKPKSKYAERKEKRAMYALGVPREPVPTRTEPFWRAQQYARDVSRTRLGDWLFDQRHLVRHAIGYGFTRHITPQGARLYCGRHLVGWHWEGYLVLSKRAPKWVRNFGALQGKTIEVWQPLTKAVVKECVDFAKEHEHDKARF